MSSGSRHHASDADVRSLGFWCDRRTNSSDFTDEAARYASRFVSHLVVCLGLMNLLALVGGLPWLGWFVGFAFGLLVIGAQAGLNSLVASSYPTSIRSDGDRLGGRNRPNYIDDRTWPGRSHAARRLGALENLPRDHLTSVARSDCCADLLPDQSGEAPATGTATQQLGTRKGVMGGKYVNSDL